MLSCACCSKQLGDLQRRACSAGRALGRWNTCGGCKAAGVRDAPVYCDAACQKAHWRSHRALDELYFKEPFKGTVGFQTSNLGGGG